MPQASLAVAAGFVSRVANDSGHGQALAEVRELRAGALVTPRRDAASEVLLFVERGQIELMIDGGSAHLGASGHARIAADRVYAYRNAGDSPARVLTIRLNAEDRRNLAARLVASVAA